MTLTVRFIAPLLAALAILAAIVSPLVDRLMLHWMVRDLNSRAQVVTSTIKEVIEINGKTVKPSASQLGAVFNRLILNEHLTALAYCDSHEKRIAMTDLFPAEIGCDQRTLDPKLVSYADEQSAIVHLDSHSLHISYQPFDQGTLLVVHRTLYFEGRRSEVKKFIFIFFIALAFIISILNVAIARWSWFSWKRGLQTLFIHRKILGRMNPELKTVEKDFRRLMRQLERERVSREDSQITWSAKTLREVLKKELAGEEILVVSNREPYIHIYNEGKIEVRSPASGLVTALEPIMRACSGTWIAQGSGDADRKVVDRKDRVAVPPNDPAYQLRRVWLSPEEEKGYYEGFSNEGIWPLCHIAHTRPIFRSEDWKTYLEVNQKFAEAVVQESKSVDPVILIQDYHFAILPQMLKKLLPQCTIITFWHIPWPNPEAFGICPWREEILAGLLGSDILGFHTRFHCNNFLDSVDRFLESRIERESSTVSYRGGETAVRNYPISIEWPPRGLKNQPSISACKKLVCEENNLPYDARIGIGVDRLDYIKGVLERFYAFERLLDVEHNLRGKLFFIQVGAPTRTSIPDYRNFEHHVREEAERINKKFGTKSIILRLSHHEPDDVVRYFRAADFCCVTSLHDGMNLVAKEFVASRDDELGVLILSQFTGAAKELVESLIVNPYNVDECAAAMKVALEMNPREQAARMRNMRQYVQEYNVYRWAGRMLLDAARMRHRAKFSARSFTTDKGGSNRDLSL